LAAITPLTRVDLPWVAEILGRPGLDETLFAAHLAPRHLRLDQAAFILGNHFEDTAYLSYLHVSVEMRRSGLASRLVAAFIEAARSAKLRRVLVSGETGKAPGYIQPGIEIPHESGALELLHGFGFKELAKAYAMSFELKDAPTLSENDKWGVRLATHTDRAALLEAIANSVPGEWEQFFTTALTINESQIIIAIDGELIGGYCHTRGDRFGPIGVLPDFRGGGLGTLVAIAALHEMRARGAKWARFTWSDAENLSFYQRIGFKTERCFQRMELLL